MSQPVGTTVANYQLYSMNEDCSVDEYHPTNLAVVSESASLIVTLFLQRLSCSTLVKKKLQIDICLQKMKTKSYANELKGDEWFSSLFANQKETGGNFLILC